jgi:trigger factor
MQVSVENSGGLQRRVTVNIPAAEILAQVEARLLDLCKKVKIKGFRPGRVPMTVVRQRYGKQVRLEVANETMQSSLQQAIRDEKLRLASAPQVANMPADITQGDLEFTALVEVYPEIDALDVGRLEIEKPTAEVTESDVDDMLLTLREQRRSWKPLERGAQAGDQVLFEYVATTGEGRVPEQGHQRLAVILGASGFAGLEGALKGLKSGDEASAELEFPTNYREPALAGKKAQVELKVTAVSESTLPELDEEFVRSFGVADGTILSLRVEIRANLERELRLAVNSILKVRIIAALVATLPDLAVPESIVRREAASLAARVAAQEGRKAAPEEAAAFMGKAAGRVRGGLLLGEIAGQNNIRIDGSRVRKAIETVAQTYEDPAEVIQLYYGNQQLLAQMENSALEEQVVDWVMENARVVSREMKFQDVISGAASLNQ